jgi:phage gp37-like protein
MEQSENSMNWMMWSGQSGEPQARGFMCLTFSVFAVGSCLLSEFAERAAQADLMNSCTGKLVNQSYLRLSSSMLIAYS